MPERKIDNEWAVVTGASSGIGLEFSRQLAAMGCNILMVSNQGDILTEAAQRVATEGGVETRTLDVDLAGDNAVDRVMDSIASLPKTPYLLINNAGIFDFRAIADMSPARLNLYVNLHMRIVTLLCQAVGEVMAKAGRGHILNMASMSCWMPMPGIAMYAATKAYIRAFSRAYRVEMLDRGVYVTVACPGGIATDLFGLPRNLQKVGVAVAALATPRKFVKKALKRTLKGKAQYINGIINRIAIVWAGTMPEWERRLVKKHLLDRLNKKNDSGD